MHGIPHFAISIALEKNDEIISGIIFDPIKNEIFYAEKGRGSYLNNKRIRVSSRRNFDEIIGLYGCPPFKKVEKNKIFDQIKKASLSIHKLRNYGSASLDFAYVGTGRLDGLWAFDISNIDFASGALIAQEGGALLSNFNGDPKYLDENNVICSTSKVYKSVLKSVKPYYMP